MKHISESIIGRKGNIKTPKYFAIHAGGSIVLKLSNLKYDRCWSDDNSVWFVLSEDQMREFIPAFPSWKWNTLANIYKLNQSPEDFKENVSFMSQRMILHALRDQLIGVEYFKK